MNKRYDRDGSYAATHDYQTSPGYLLEVVVQGYEAITVSIAQKQFHCCDSHKWALDYLETGLKLLGYSEAASLVKKDFLKSANTFTQNLGEQAKAQAVSKIQKKLGKKSS